MASPNAVQRLQEKAVKAEETIAYLKNEIALLKKHVESDTISTDQIRSELLAENKKLAKDVEIAMQQLMKLEIANGKIQVPLPSSNVKVAPVKESETVKKIQQEVKAKQDNKKSSTLEPAPEGEQAGGKVKKAKKPQAPKQPEKAEDDITRLDLRVGLIISAERHPDADSLYLEKINVGSEEPLTVISGLAGKVALEDLHNRLVILLCNLKPSKMRGIISQAMVMCASEPGGKVEVLRPPAGSAPGDRVALEGQDLSQPDTQLKSKNWEAVAAKLRTRQDLVAAFDGKALVVPGKGLITTESLIGVPIK